MKTTWTFFLALFITANLVIAQDTLYVYKTGAVIYKQAVTGVDSVTFYKPSFPTNGLVAWWPFNGNANDESGNLHNGTVNGATLTSDRFGKVNSSYSFNGSGNQWIDCGTSAVFAQTTNMTISAWVYLNVFSSNGNVGYIITGTYDGLSSSGYIFNVVGPSKANLSFRWSSPTSQTETGNSNLNINTWYHVVITYDGNSTKLYLNGILDKSQIDSNPIGKTHLYIGGSGSVWYAPTFNMNGKIDDVGIWNRALSQQEIIYLYNAK